MNERQRLARWMFLSAHRREHPRGRPPGRGEGYAPEPLPIPIIPRSRSISHDNPEGSDVLALDHAVPSAPSRQIGEPPPRVLSSSTPPGRFMTVYAGGPRHTIVGKSTRFF